jgi:hypothetical protein
VVTVLDHGRGFDPAPGAGIYLEITMPLAKRTHKNDLER